MAKTALEFYQMSGFPGVIGVVDGTHVRIQRPSEEERAYINRHHHHSINVQVISLTCNCMNKRCTSKICVWNNIIRHQIRVPPRRVIPFQLNGDWQMLVSLFFILFRWLPMHSGWSQTWWCAGLVGHMMPTYGTDASWKIASAMGISTNTGKKTFDTLFCYHNHQKWVFCVKRFPHNFITTLSSCSYWWINKANLRDLIGATGLEILLKLDSNRRFSARVTLRFDGWPLKTIWHLFYTTSSWNNILETLNSGQNRRFFVTCDLESWWMTLKNNRAPLQYYVKPCASFQSHGWIQIGVTVRKCSIWVKKSAIFCPILRMTLKNNRASLLCCFKLGASFYCHQWI